jgi:hypothetical protein
MAEATTIITELLGKTYRGRPYGLALDLWILEQRGEAEKARKLLDAHNHIASVFGQPPHDLSRDFSDMPMEGGFCFRAVR